MKADGGFLRPPHASAIDTPGCDGRPREHNDLEGIAGTGETPVSHPNTDKEADSQPAPRFTSLDCAGCADLREKANRLAEHNLVLLDRVRAFEERDRLGAEMLLGLAGLQRAPQ